MIKTFIEPDSSKNRNLLRSKVFKDSNRRIRPGGKYVRNYKLFLEEEFTAALKKQLGISRRVYNKISTGLEQARTNWTKIGVSSGALRSSIVAQANVTRVKDTSKGTYNIDYSFSSSFKDYGEYISDGKKPSIVNIDAIENWLKFKGITLYLPMSKRVKGFKAQQVQKKRMSPEKLRKSVAMAIYMTHLKNRRPPVIKDWQRIDKNEKLRIEFEKRTKKKGAYLRSQIRRSIMRNISSK